VAALLLLLCPVVVQLCALENKWHQQHALLFVQSSLTARTPVDAVDDGDNWGAVLAVPVSPAHHTLVRMLISPPSNTVPRLWVRHQPPAAHCMKVVLPEAEQVHTNGAG
jgi:hypothetical protein